VKDKLSKLGQQMLQGVEGLKEHLKCQRSHHGFVF
jgi:hypothetical protein